MSDETIVMPGDSLSTEEENMPAVNSFADNGHIYASAVGRVQRSDGQIGVQSTSSVRRIAKNMMVVGVVTDYLRAVAFLKLDNMVINGVRFVAPKDGKILLEDDRHGPRPGPGHQEERKSQPMKPGDVILARVLFDDPDIYTLGIREPDTGVIHANCELCGSSLKRSDHSLVCPSCEHREHRKLSALFGDVDGVQRILREPPARSEHRPRPEYHRMGHGPRHDRGPGPRMGHGPGHGHRPHSE
ncbi:MAG: exosome complex RNA-binding protein Csl4 [Candidatus Micrarchaeota archaeon]|nr:exosome complex RNA-binding protein Csl4 [Candidatus Micrarchaeota archaeon]